MLTFFLPKILFALLIFKKPLGKEFQTTMSRNSALKIGNFLTVRVSTKSAFGEVAERFVTRFEFEKERLRKFSFLFLVNNLLCNLNIILYQRFLARFFIV